MKKIKQKHETAKEIADDLNEITRIYTFTYVFECDEGLDPAEQLEQEFYDITSNNDKITRFGIIEEGIFKRVPEKYNGKAC